MAVGNPLALLVKERRISGHNEGFWSSYLRLCLENNTFESDYIKKEAPHVHSVYMDALKGMLQKNSKMVRILHSFI